MNFNKIRLEGIDWVNVGQDRDTWQIVVNKVKNLSIPTMWTIF